MATSRQVLQHDADERAYRHILEPMLLAQLALYLFALGRFTAAPGYAPLPGADDPLLHENHLGNIAIMASQPDRLLLGLHMGVAVLWVAGVLLQKRIVRAMARSTGARYLRLRRGHVWLGGAMVLAALAGCVAGPLLALRHHGHPAMQAFLLALPLYFLPAIVMVWVSARRRALAAHRFWATAAFVGPAVSSLWAEGLIYVCGRFALGPRAGELVGTGIAFALGGFVVLRPAWAAWRQQAQPAENGKIASGLAARR